MSKRAEILEALATRLQSITTANGYSTDVKKVFWNDIPLGMDLGDHEVPSILILDKECRVTHQFTDLELEWFFELQLIHAQVSDTLMLDFSRDVVKCLYANSPVVESSSYLRFHPLVYDLQITSFYGDLHTIDANRFAIMEIIVFFGTKIWDL
jgi:hypothetical protein